MMQPTDTNAPAPAPMPAPEPPKKQSFWAKLFGGKKPAAPVVPANFESQTPAPKLDDAPASPTEMPAASDSLAAVSVDPVPAVDPLAAPAMTEPTQLPSEPVNPLPPAPTQPVEPMPAPSDPTPPAGPVPPVQ